LGQLALSQTLWSPIPRSMLAICTPWAADILLLSQGGFLFSSIIDLEKIVNNTAFVV
jgi:hypothetical protein